MASQLTANIQTFIQKLDGLRDWPDKMAITELSAITEKNIGFAEHFAKILVAKLTDQRTHSTYKLPIFYVIDSIMKHVGGPFAVLFATQFAECYPQAVADLHEKDRGRLSFLLDTWKERRFMSSDLLSRMKSAANATPLVPATAASNVPVAPRGGPATHLAAPGRPLPVVQPQHNLPRPVMPQRAAPVAQVHHHPQSALSGPAATAVHTRAAPALVAPNAAAPASADPFAAGMFADLVQNEMVAMLAQMYAEMGVSNPMSLEQLRAANPPLYDQIRAKAEERARAILAQRQQAASPLLGHGAAGYAHGPGAGGYPPVASPQGVYPAAATANYNRKRPADYPPQLQQQQQWGPPAQYARQDQPIAHYSSRFSAQSHAGQYNGATHGAGSDFNDALSAEQQEAARLAAQRRREEEARYFDELRVKYASDHFVNGFLNEAPVVVDVARVQALADVLRCQYSNADPHVFENNLNHTVGSVNGSETAPAASGGTVHVKTEGSADVSAAPTSAGEGAPTAQPALPLSSGFLAASRTLTHRLDAYLRDVHTPPRLPSALFGPLPLAPIYGQSAEALDEIDRQQRAKASAATAASANAAPTLSRPVAKKFPVPPFRMEELGRNPERAVAAMYGDKPHQFHEDGLRFRSLAELKQHTDKHMEVKKLLLKRAAVREYRDWYCTSAQWVTDFSALSLAGTSAGATGSGPASSSSSSGAGKANGSGGAAAGKDAEEEYILPADENFTRCPVSREVFECVWDGAEGEMMYRNAVKVLVTEAADPALFRLARPVPWEDDQATSGDSAAPPVRYLIVHKLLVLDPWLAAGKAVPLQDALIRYKTAVNGGHQGQGQGQAKAERLLAAVGQDDDEEDVFVLLEFGNT